MVDDTRFRLILRGNPPLRVALARATHRTPGAVRHWRSRTYPPIVLYGIIRRVVLDLEGIGLEIADIYPDAVMGRLIPDGVDPEAFLGRRRGGARRPPCP